MRRATHRQQRGGAAPSPGSGQRCLAGCEDVRTGVNTASSVAAACASKDCSGQGGAADLACEAAFYPARSGEATGWGEIPPTNAERPSGRLDVRAGPR
mmetsp:Transcript_25341/g.43286  ORF Transcript_25341/g.43286 Transcript_25341/m.43286 type:complete len:98 (+) Transcript_25341:423-716(+)